MKTRFTAATSKPSAGKKKLCSANQEIGEELNENYSVGNSVKVVNGVLYQSVPNGLELVSYPKLKKATDYAVESGTVRISATAFAGNENLKHVTIASTVKALGDKAFYGCNALSVAVFLGYDAPALEEEYDSTYAATENLPYNSGSGNVSVSKYYMWNASASHGELFYYGATFVDRIGTSDKTLVMVRPANRTELRFVYFRAVFLGDDRRQQRGNAGNVERHRDDCGA